MQSSLNLEKWQWDVMFLFRVPNEQTIVTWFVIHSTVEALGCLLESSIPYWELEPVPDDCLIHFKHILLGFRSLHSIMLMPQLPDAELLEKLDESFDSNLRSIPLQISDIRLHFLMLLECNELKYHLWSDVEDYLLHPHTDSVLVWIFHWLVLGFKGHLHPVCEWIDNMLHF